MRFPSSFLLIGILLSPLSKASAQSQDSAVVRRELMAIENEIARANRECDYAYFARVEADEFIFTDARGNLTTRKQDLAGEKDCRKSESTQAFDEVVVQPHGNTALLSALSTTTFAGRDGKSVIRRNRFTDVFVWRDGRWQLVAGHSSLLR